MKSILYIIPALIWGTSWYAIKFQLGDVEPTLSIAFRFLLSAGLIFSYLNLKKKNCSLSLHDHLWFCMQGFFLFGINYWLIYQVEIDLTSGIVALIFSILPILNIINRRIFLNLRCKKRTFLGSLIGLFGLFIIFKEDFYLIGEKSNFNASIWLCVVAVLITSLGNVITDRYHNSRVPVLQANAYAMSYGAGSMFFISLFSGNSIIPDIRISYLFSLLYLSIFGSIIAFTCYLSLVRKVGSDKASYLTIVYPVIALLISTLFESYTWSFFKIVGLMLIFLGNFIVLLKDPIKMINQVFITKIIRDIEMIRRLVGSISEHQLRHVEYAVNEDMGLFMPNGAPCYYAISPDHTHPSYSFIYAFDSSFRLRIEKKEIVSTHGMVYAISPGMPHHEVESHTQPRYIAIFISAPYFEEQLELYKIKERPLFIAHAYHEKGDLVAPMAEFVNEYEIAAPGYKKLMQANCLKITHILIRMIYNIGKKDQSISDRALINRVISFM